MNCINFLSTKSYWAFVARCWSSKIAKYMADLSSVLWAFAWLSFVLKHSNLSTWFRRAWFAVWLFRLFGLGVGFQRVSSSVDCFSSYQLHCSHIIFVAWSQGPMHHMACKLRFIYRVRVDGITDVHWMLCYKFGTCFLDFFCFVYFEFGSISCTICRPV